MNWWQVGIVCIFVFEAGLMVKLAVEKTGRSVEDKIEELRKQIAKAKL
jgi:hypothetical protein